MKLHIDSDVLFIAACLAATLVLAWSATCRWHEVSETLPHGSWGAK